MIATHGKGWHLSPTTCDSKTDYSTMFLVINVRFYRVTNRGYLQLKDCGVLLAAYARHYSADSAAFVIRVRLLQVRLFSA